MSVIPVGGGGGPSLPPVGGPAPPLSMPLPPAAAPPSGAGPSLFVSTFSSILPAPKITLLEYSNVVSKSINEARSTKNEADAEIDNAEKAIRLNLAQYAALVRNLLSTARRLGPAENALFTTINAQVTDFNSTILPPFFTQLQTKINLLNNAISTYNAGIPSPAAAAILQLAIDNYNTQTAALDSSYSAAATLFNNNVAINNTQLTAINVARAQFGLAPLALEPTAPTTLGAPVAPAPFATIPTLPAFVTPLQAPYTFVSPAQSALLNTINTQIAAQNTNISIPYSNQITAAISALNSAITDFNNNVINDTQLQAAVDNYNNFSNAISAGYAASAAAYNAQVDANNLEIVNLNSAAAELIPPGTLIALQQHIPLTIALPEAPQPFLIPPLFIAPIGTLSSFAFPTVPTYPVNEDVLIGLIAEQVADFNTNVLSPLFAQAQNEVNTLNNAINAYNASLFTPADQLTFQQAIDNYNIQINTINNNYSLLSTSFNNLVTENNSQLAAFNVIRASLNLAAHPLEEAAAVSLGLTTTLSPFAPVAAMAPVAPPASQSLYDVVTGEQQALSDAINSQINELYANIITPYSAQITALIDTLNTSIASFNSNLITDIDLQIQVDNYNNSINTITNNYAISAAAYNSQVVLNNSAIVTANQNAALLYPNAAVFLAQDTIPATLAVPAAPLPIFNPPVGFTPSLVWPSVASYSGNENPLASTINAEIANYNDNILPAILSQAQNAVSTLDLAIQTYNTTPLTSGSLATIQQAIVDYQAQATLLSANYLAAATAFNNVVAANNVQLNAENLARQLLFLPAFPLQAAAATLLSMPQAPTTIPPSTPLPLLTPPVQELYDVMTIDQQTLTNTINSQINDQNNTIATFYGPQITALIDTLNGAIANFNSNLITDVDLQGFVDNYNNSLNIIMSDYAASATAFNAQVVANNNAIAAANQDAALLYPGNSAILALQDTIPTTLANLPQAPAPIFNAPVGYTPSLVWPPIAAYPGNENALAATINAQISDYNTNILPPIVLQAQNAISAIESALQIYNSNPSTVSSQATLQQAITSYDAQIALVSADYLSAATVFNNNVAINNGQLAILNAARALLSLPPFSDEQAVATTLATPTVGAPSILAPIPIPVPFTLTSFSSTTPEQQNLLAAISAQITAENDNVITPLSLQITAAIDALNSAITDFNNNIITNIQLQVEVDAYNATAAALTASYVDSATTFNALVDANNDAILIANQNALSINPNAVQISFEQAMPATISLPTAPIPPFLAPVTLSAAFTLPQLAGYVGNDDALLLAINAEISDFNVNTLPPISSQVQAAIDALNNAIATYNGIMPPTTLSQADLAQAVSDYNTQIAIINGSYLITATTFNQSVALNNAQIATINVTRVAQSLPPYALQQLVPTQLNPPAAPPPPTAIPIPLLSPFVPFSIPLYNFMTPEQAAIISMVNGQIDLQNTSFSIPYAAMITAAIDSLNLSINDFNNNLITDVQLQTQIDAYNATGATIMNDYANSAIAFNNQVALNNAAIQTLNQDTLQLDASAAILSIEASIPATITLPAAALPPLIAPIANIPSFVFPVVPPYPGLDFNTLSQSLLAPMLSVGFSFFSNYNTAQRWATDFRNYQRFVVSRRKSYLLSLFLQGVASISGDPALNSVGFTGLARTTSHVLETLLSGNMIQAVEKFLNIRLTATSMHDLRLFNLALFQQTAIAAVLPALGRLQDLLPGLTPDSEAIQIALATELIKQLTQITTTDQFTQQIAKLLSQTPELSQLSLEQLSALVNLLSTATTLSLVKAALLQLAVVLQTPGLLANLLKNIPQLKSLLTPPSKASGGGSGATAPTTVVPTTSIPVGPIGPVKVSQPFQISEPLHETSKLNTVDIIKEPVTHPIEPKLPVSPQSEPVKKNREDLVRENEPLPTQEREIQRVDTPEASPKQPQGSQLPERQPQDQQLQQQQPQNQQFQIQSQQSQDKQSSNRQPRDKQLQNQQLPQPLQSPQLLQPLQEQQLSEPQNQQLPQPLQNQQGPSKEITLPSPNKLAYKRSTEPIRTPRLPPNILPIQRPAQKTPDTSTLDLRPNVPQQPPQIITPAFSTTTERNFNPLQEQITQQPLNTANYAPDLNYTSEPSLSIAAYKEKTPERVTISLSQATTPNQPPLPPPEPITNYNQLFSQKNFTDELIHSLPNTLPTASQQLRRPSPVEPLTSAIRATAALPPTSPEDFFSSFGNNLMKAGFTPEQAKSLTIKAAEVSITTQTPLVLASSQIDQGEYLRASERLLSYLHSRQFIRSGDEPFITSNGNLQQQEQQQPFVTPSQGQQTLQKASSARSSLFQEDVLKNSLEQAIIANRGLSQQHAEQIANRLVDRIIARSPEFDSELDLRRALAQELLGVKSNKIGLPFSFQEARALAQQLEIAPSPPLTLEQQPLMNPNWETPPIPLDVLATSLQKHIVDLLTPQVGVAQAELLSQDLLQQLLGVKTPQVLVQEELKAPLSLVNVLKKEFKKILDENNIELRNEAAKQFRELISPSIDLFVFVQRLLDPANSLVLSSMTGLMYSSKPVGGKEHPLQFYA